MSDITNEFESNSYKSREKLASSSEEKRVRKVVTGPVKVKKKSETRRLADLFLSEDAATIKQYLIWDELIPAIKDLVSRMIKNGTDILLFGEKGCSRSSSKSRNSYSGYYEKSSERRSYEDSRTRSRFDYENIVIPTRGEAEETLDEMQDAIDRFGVVRVTDLYDIVGRTAPFTGGRYGWRTIQGAKPIRVDDGYILKLPRPQPID